MILEIKDPRTIELLQNNKLDDIDAFQEWVKLTLESIIEKSNRSNLQTLLDEFQDAFVDEVAPSHFYIDRKPRCMIHICMSDDIDTFLSYKSSVHSIMYSDVRIRGKKQFQVEVVDDKITLFVGNSCVPLPVAANIIDQLSLAMDCISGRLSYVADFIADVETRLAEIKHVIARCHVIDEGKNKLEVSLASGITWDFFNKEIENSPNFGAVNLKHLKIAFDKWCEQNNVSSLDKVEDLKREVDELFGVENWVTDSSCGTVTSKEQLLDWTGISDDLTNNKYTLRVRNGWRGYKIKHGPSCDVKRVKIKN